MQEYLHVFLRAVHEGKKAYEQPEKETLDLAAVAQGKMRELMVPIDANAHIGEPNVHGFLIARASRSAVDALLHAGIEEIDQIHRSEHSPGYYD